jgi:hypothetical protein
MKSFVQILFLLIISNSLNDFKMVQTETIIQNYENQEFSLDTFNAFASQILSKCEILIQKLTSKQKLFVEILEEEYPNIFLEFCIRLIHDEITWAVSDHETIQEIVNKPFKWGKRSIVEK